MNNKTIAKLLLSLGFFALLPISSVSAAGTFSISPSNGNYLKSCTQSVTIAIDVTSGESNAADVILNYDTTKIEIIDALPSVAGIQILPGNAYESYAGNSVNALAGEIRLVGYSSNGSLQGTATFATIYFHSKPAATNGGFSFVFTGENPYNTLDTNIADTSTSFDMLSGVTNANYTFSNGSCATDTTPPDTTFISPTHLASNVSPTSTVTLKVSDSGTGVSLPSINIIINGVTYTSTSPEVSISGSPTSYTFTLVPSTPFPTNSVSVMTVTASDTAGNSKTTSISFNSNYSCPVTYITKIGSCPALTPTPSTTVLDRESPLITVVSETVIDVKKSFTLEIVAHDNNGLSPDSFVLNIGAKTFTLASSPDRIKVNGSKNDYTFTIELRPEELELTDEGKIVGSVKISDLEGNIRIERLIFSTNGIVPTKPGQTSSASTFQDMVARTVLYYLAPLVLAMYFALFAILSTQPVVALVQNENRKPIRFPRGYLLFPDGSQQNLHGGVNGKLHGKFPHETVKLVVQKYGYNALTLLLHPSVKNSEQVITLSRISPTKSNAEGHQRPPKHLGYSTGQTR